MLLQDEAVLAQAWKKTDSDVRRHNWYADTLELEHTTLLLPKMIQIWSGELSRGPLVEKPTPARVVQAPKNAEWHFPSEDGGGWIFKKRTDESGNCISEPELRPLAHLTVRDQVFATAVMLCIADSVESLQGNTDSTTYTTTLEARAHTLSYGNRLFCDWTKCSTGRQHARYRWGNSKTYSQFFRDYERFLERPATVCRESSPSMQGRRLFVVKLDLAKFYDSINQHKVVARLKKMWAEYSESFHLPSPVGEDADEEGFWSTAERVLSWTWNSDDSKKAGNLKMGLPQGLIASGFLANAYMHYFDREISSQFGSTLDVSKLAMTRELGSIGSFTLIDYCRYVDDMRLVISLSETESASLSMECLASVISAWINQKLSDYEGEGSQLSTKPEKSEAMAWEDFAVQGSASQYMRGVQGQISMSPDPSTLLHATGSLDHLLWLADTIDGGVENESNSLALSKISVPKVDVRDDTIRRFAANRLRQVLRLRRSMADPDLPASDSISGKSVSELRALDHEMEAVARKLVSCWSRNPALVSVLRCGLDIFPSPDLLRPVTEALLSKISNLKKPSKETLVALYVLADLFRAAITETGYDRKESYPSNSDVSKYRTELIHVALRLTPEPDLPWYLRQQVALFLAAMRYPVPISIKDNGELAQHARLHYALRYMPPKSSKSEHLTAALLVLKITGDREKFVVWIGHWLDKLAASNAKRLVDELATIEPSVLPEILHGYASHSNKSWINRVRKLIPCPANLDHAQPLIAWSPGKRPLTAIAAHPENPFVQENALLKLAGELLKENSEHLNDSDICIQRIGVECDEWGQIQDPSTRIAVTVTAKLKYLPPWLETPPWVRPSMAWAYRLGRVLRSAIIGESDYTSRHYPLREHEIDRYRGIQTSWYKRRLGLMPLTAGLGAEPTPISPWLNELIMHLLQWPGLELQGDCSDEFRHIKSPADLYRLILARQKVQNGYYGTLSKLPAYLLPVGGGKATDLSKFRIALVQTLMPMNTDFCATDPLLWTPSYRARHRSHLASMCRLITQQLAASRFATKSREDNLALLDLIVFPELSIHPEDMWLLRRLSDSTGATIFAGQTFVKHPYLDKPVNRAAWILRQGTGSGRSITTVYQGKKNGIAWEVSNGVASHRPYQIIIQFSDGDGNTANLTGSICYDATDLKLAADMRDISDGFIISALNKDVSTFDNMASALHFHMYQPIILANTGQFGGSTAQAPFKEHHQRYIAHTHGTNQAAVSIFDIDLTTFKSPSNSKPMKEKKSAPAGFTGRG
jgi:hypothetical protein